MGMKGNNGGPGMPPANWHANTGYGYDGNFDEAAYKKLWMLRWNEMQKASGLGGYYRLFGTPNVHSDDDIWGGLINAKRYYDVDKAIVMRRAAKVRLEREAALRRAQLALRNGHAQGYVEGHAAGNAHGYVEGFDLGRYVGDSKARSTVYHTTDSLYSGRPMSSNGLQEYYDTYMRPSFFGKPMSATRTIVGNDTTYTGSSRNALRDYNLMRLLYNRAHGIKDLTTKLPATGTTIRGLIQDELL